MKTTKTLSIAGDYKKLEEKLLELTKDNFSWSVEYENEETEDIETLILCDFVYREDPFAEDELDFQWSEKHISDYFLALYCKHKLNIKVEKEQEYV